MCNHNPNNKDTTIIIDTKHWYGILQNSKIYKGICKECHKQFDIIKENNIYQIIK